jgi:hypothetical protein
MSMRDHYRTRAAEFHARAQNESDQMVRREYENLAKQFLHLAKNDLWLGARLFTWRIWSFVYHARYRSL